MPFLDALSGSDLPALQIDGLLDRLFRDRATSLRKLVRASNRVGESTELRPVAGAQLPHHEILDRLLGHVDMPDSLAASSAAASTRDTNGQPELRQRLNDALTALLDGALSEEEFRRLRRTWQSLRLLSEAQNDCSWCELHVIGGAGTARELGAALERLEPDLLVLEAPMSACPRDAD
ncbi:MAG: hypothetical protein QM784_30075 [Polyangiaceae bacterium]